MEAGGAGGQPPPAPGEAQVVRGLLGPSSPGHCPHTCSGRPHSAAVQSECSGARPFKTRRPSQAPPWEDGEQTGEEGTPTHARSPAGSVPAAEGAVRHGAAKGASAESGRAGGRVRAGRRRRWKEPRGRPAPARPLGWERRRPWSPASAGSARAPVPRGGTVALHTELPCVLLTLQVRKRTPAPCPPSQGW